ncbi:BTB/POZ and MATH domain-containing protein 3-like [Papaver somniferum]|uniref:BTB/POZ and MATH domain-containing protein 3-like n=1 Tax=Papaver somniferum TaxID=3469 RepID=UPI000E6FB8AB|nr:BTB/POZ and MATH domain-containing protein 3-like [Papaver somniferum]
MARAAKRPKVSSSQSIYETVEGSLEYEIKGYSLAKGMGVGNSMTSGKFTVAGYDLSIRFYPDGYDQASKDCISVAVTLLKFNKGDTARVLLEFKLLDQTGQGKYGVYATSNSPLTIHSEWIWGSTRYMSRSDFETSNYLKDDCLSIHCIVGVLQERTRVEERKVIPVPPSDMSQNLKGLLQSEIGSDVTIQVGNELFRAHKSILAARSPVFRAQFFGLVGNPDKEKVAIEDFDPFAFKAMLLFLYSDELPEPHELSDSDSLCNSTTIAQLLLAATDIM